MGNNSGPVYPYTQYFYINGINTDKRRAQKQARKLGKLVNDKVTLLYNPAERKWGWIRSRFL